MSKRFQVVWWWWPPLLWEFHRKPYRWEGGLDLIYEWAIQFGPLEIRRWRDAE